MMGDQTLLEQAQLEAERIARERGNRVGLTLAYDRERDQTSAQGSFSKVWGKWAATVWGRWTRKAGPDEGQVGGSIERKF